MNLADMILGIFARSSTKDTDASRDGAAISIARMIRQKITARPSDYPDQFSAPGQVIEVRGVDEMGKDIANALQRALNGDKGINKDQEADVVLFFTGISRRGHYMKQLVREEGESTGRVATFFSIFAKDEGGREKPWVLLPQSSTVNPVAEFMKSVMTDDLSMADADNHPDKKVPVETRARIRESLDGLIGNVKERVEAAESCKGCSIGLFTSGTKSAYMKFCPGDAMGDVLSSAAPLVGAVGLAGITITPLGNNPPPADAVVHPMES